MGFLQGLIPASPPPLVDFVSSKRQSTCLPLGGGALSSRFRGRFFEIFKYLPSQGRRPFARRVWSEGLVWKNKLYLFFTLILFSIAATAQERKEKKQYIRLVAGPVLSFYQNNSFHTNDSKPRYAFFALAGVDFQIHKDFTFMPAIEYAYHGITFNSYYLAPGYQFLYDKHYDYNYRLTLQEARLNVMVKQTIGVETRNMITGYTACGYVLRYLFSSNLLVTSNLTGAEMFKGKPNIAFEHPVFTTNTASAVKFVAGVQRNFFKTHHAFFFEASFTFSLSRFSLTESFAPSNLNINGSFLQLGLGVKL